MAKLKNAASNTKKPITVLCTYRVRKGKEPAFERLLAKHWPTLSRLGLVTRTKPTYFRSKDRTGGSLVIELFSWKSSASPELAHASPAVMSIWEQMGTLTESRDGLPAMEFPEVSPLKLPAPKAQKRSAAPKRKSR